MDPLILKQLSECAESCDNKNLEKLIKKYLIINQDVDTIKDFIDLLEYRKYDCEQIYMIIGDFDPIGYVLLGELNYKKHKFDDAINCYNNAFKIIDNKHKLYERLMINFSLVYLSLEMFDMAEKYLFQLEPNIIEQYKHLLYDFYKNLCVPNKICEIRYELFKLKEKYEDIKLKYDFLPNVGTEFINTLNELNKEGIIKK